MHRFKNIGVVIDLKRSNSTSLAYAKDLIETNQAKVHLLCVLPSTMTDSQRQTIKESIEEKVDFSFILAFITQKSAIEITQYSEENKIDMILIEPDSQKTKVNRFFYGSLSLSLMRKTPCPVWVIKKPHSEKYQRILIAVDPEENSTDAKLNDKLIQIGTSLAKRQSAECLLVTAWRLEGESALEGPFINMPKDETDQLKAERKAECAQAFQQLQQNNTEHLKGVQTHMLHGEPGYAIADFVATNNIDLVIMGTVGRAGIKGFLIGNTAETIVNLVDCSVMAVKPDNFISPL